MTTVEEQVSELMQLVAENVADIVTSPLRDGFRRSFPAAATTFRIHSLDQRARENQPMGVAEIVTVFDDRDLDPLDDWDAARANRWSVWGHARRTGRGQFEVRCRVILYRGGEAGWKTYAGALGSAFRQQAAMHIGALSSRLSRDEYLRWRNDLRRPREWIEVPPADVWTDVAQTVRLRNGLISSVEPDAVVFEVPLDEPSRSGRRERPETALIRITSRVQHPIAGAGFLATLAIPRDLGADTAAWAEVLNAAEARESDFVPGFGAWSTSGIEDEDLVHSIFWPTQNGVHHAGMVDQLARWQMIRADWLGRTHWRQVAYDDPPVGASAAVLPLDAVERTLDEVRAQLERMGICPEENEGSFAFAREPNRCVVQVVPASPGVRGEASVPRVVTTTELPDRDVELAFGREHVTNRLAFMSALVTSGSSATILASAPLSPRSFPIAGALATWGAYLGGWALLEGSRRIALGRPLPDHTKAETAWTDDDLVRIDYDRAHVLGGGLASGWEYPYRLGGFGAVVRVLPVAKHPSLGGGLLCTLTVEGLEVSPEQFHKLVNALNQIEYDQNAIPFFGAWCEASTDNELAFVAFLPNRFRDPELADYVIGSLTKRATRTIAAGPEAMIELLARVQKA